MKIIKSLEAWRDFQKQRDRESSIGFVPTMGALHEGHLSLISKSSAENDITVVSIFVNPTQFNNSEDFTNYPNTWDKDVAALEEMGVDVLFSPPKEALYPLDFTFFVDESQDSLGLCGTDRPGHFRGVLTILMKLFHLISPTRAYFGKKDYQQYRLVKNMTEAFFMDVDVVGCETLRDEQGLALSSRNLRLSPEERVKAQKMNGILRDKTLSLSQQRTLLESMGFRVQYLEEQWGRRFIAAEIGPVRLIDNASIS